MILGKVNLKTLVISVSLVATSTVATLIFLDTRVASETRKGMRVAEAEHKALDSRVTTLEKRFDRFDQKMDAVMDKLGVPLLSPLDAGK